MKAVILAGGKGQRLAPYSTILPKPLMPVGDMPVMEIVLLQLKKAGIKDIIVCTGHLAGLIEAYFGNGKSLGLNISYSKEDKSLGTAGPLALIRKKLKVSFLVINGDTLSDMNYSSMIRFHEEKRSTVTIAMYKKKVQIQLGTLETSSDGTIQGYIEKPSYEYMASIGIYVMTRNVFKYIKKDTFYNLPDLVKDLIKAGEKVCGYNHKGMWFDIGTISDYQEAEQVFSKKKKSFLGS